jgi:hypothetical protein
MRLKRTTETKLVFKAVAALLNSSAVSRTGGPDSAVSNRLEVSSRVSTLRSESSRGSTLRTF